MPAAANFTMSPVKFDVTALKGGLDQLTPSLSLHAGICRDASNFECAVTGGYSRIAGYERFDGRAKPSDATYSILQVVSFTNVPSVGQTIEGFTSGATAEIIAVDQTNKYMAITKVTGTFIDGEVLEVGATTIGVQTPRTVTISALLHAQYLNLAADVYRALIGAVPGSGAIRGIVSAVLSGAHEVFAFRDNVGGTAVDIYKASTSGWTQVTLFSEVSFTAGGTSTPAEGNTLTQGANTATIKRIVLESGTWAGGDAAGRFIITTPTPGNFAAGAATIGAVNVTLSGAQTAITLSPGGKFTFDIGNFSGQLATRRIYGADGVNRCFEFDGTILVPIDTQTSNDTPKHIRVHHHHLFVSIGSSLLHSGLGTPYKFSAAAGGGEIAVGDSITNLLIQPGNQDNAAMAVISRNGSAMLYGTSVSTWKLVTYASSTGGIDYMGQNLDRSYILDDRGLVNLQAAQEFGNFSQATITQHLQTFINAKQLLAACSTISKSKSQYRAFFTDKSGLYVTIANGKFLGALPIMTAHAFNVAWTGELANGDDVAYVGASSGGYVYQLDKGSSFDGDNIDAWITLNWNFMKSPRLIKHYRRASIEIQGNFYAAIRVGYTLGYNDSKISQPTTKDYSSNFSAGNNWDEVSWDAFVWDGNTLSPTEAKLGGRAENIQYTISSTTDYVMAYTVNSIITHFSPGRLKR